MEAGNNNTDAYLRRAYALSSTDDAKDLYDEWAASYDADLKAEKYASPGLAVKALVQNLVSTDEPIQILDAGCGTGLVGQALAASSVGGKIQVDGVDISEGMLNVARSTNAYRHLALADLNRPLSQRDGSYDALICVGTLTKGHVGPAVLGEFCRVVRDGGLVVVTVHAEIWASMGFKGEVETLTATNAVSLVSSTDFGFTESTNTGGKMMVLRKSPPTDRS